MYRSTVRPGVPGIPRCCYGVPYGWHGMNMKVEPTISAQKKPGLPLRAAAVRLLGGVGGWGVGALRELAATTNKSLPRQQPRGPSAERARGGGWRRGVRAQPLRRALGVCGYNCRIARRMPRPRRPRRAHPPHPRSTRRLHRRNIFENILKQIGHATATWERDNSATIFPTPGLFAARG
jgi:hypothetical protein